MIKAAIFDLDGTLVQTEILKAKSYAEAAIQLSENRLSESEIIAAFKNVVGLSRREVAIHLMNEFGLQNAAQKRMEDFGVTTPWQAFVQLRLKVYQTFLNEPAILKSYRCPYNLDLLKTVRKKGLKTGLATMSHCEQTGKVLDILELKNMFDFVATRDDVDAGKPDPEIYLLVASQLQMKPEVCLVIEDSVNGIKAALSAGMNCLAVTSDFTRESVHKSKVLDEKWIIDHPRRLLATAEQRMAEIL
ncbi:MAG TPA: HAD family phosphatase [bacterium]|nr:HAD family phosphatase [bacterium]